MEYTRGKFIGEGLRGKVYLSHDSQGNNFAMKIEYVKTKSHIQYATGRIGLCPLRDRRSRLASDRDLEV